MSRITAFVRGRRLGPFFAIVALALALRIAVVYVVDYAPVYDAIDYDLHARSIVAGDGYPDDPLVYSSRGPTAFRPPGYPYFLAGVYKVTGGQIRAARLSQALVGTVTVCLIALIASQLWDRRRALAAAAIAAIYPPLIFVGNAVISESLFLLFELAVVAAILRYRAARKPGWLLGAAVCAGLAILTRPNGLVLLPILFIAAVPVGRDRSWRALGPAVAVVAIALLTVAPWTIRNAFVMDAFVPLTTQAGYTTHGVYNAITRDGPRPGAWRPTTTYRRFRHLYDPDQTEVETDDRLRSATLDFAKAHPLYVLEAGAKNALRMLELTGLAWGRQSAIGIGMSSRVGEVGTVSFWILLVFAVAGAFTAAARRTPWFIWAAGVVLLVSVVFTATDVRYRLPVDPVLILLAALAVASAWERWEPGRGAERPDPARMRVART